MNGQRAQSERIFQLRTLPQTFVCVLPVWFIVGLAQLCNGELIEGGGVATFRRLFNQMQAAFFIGIWQQAEQMQASQVVASLGLPARCREFKRGNCLDDFACGKQGSCLLPLLSAV